MDQVQSKVKVCRPNNSDKLQGLDNEYRCSVYLYSLVWIRFIQMKRFGLHAISADKVYRSGADGFRIFTRIGRMTIIVSDRGLGLGQRGTDQFLFQTKHRQTQDKAYLNDWCCETITLVQLTVKSTSGAPVSGPHTDQLSSF